MTKPYEGVELARRMVAGDERAYEEFADEYIPQLYRFALFRLDRDPDLTREVVQAAVCKAIAKLPGFRGRAALMTWLCSICLREIGAHFRGKRRPYREVELDAADGTLERPGAAPPAGPEGELLRREAADLVHLALDWLPPRYGRALEWKYLEELPVREIARRLGTSPKAAESLLTRARVKLRERYMELTANPGAPAAAASPEPRMVES